MRMRTIFHVLCALIALGSPALAGQPECDDCELLEHGIHRQVIPTDDYDCLWFIQPQPGRVLLKLYLQNGTVRSYTSKPERSGKVGYICPGRDFVRQMTTESYICGDSGSFVYGQPEWLESLAEKPKYSKAVTACLFGREECARMDYPAFGYGFEKPK